MNQCNTVLNSMKTIIVSSNRYDPTAHVLDILDNAINQTNAKILTRVYFLDRRVDTRMGMTTYVVESSTTQDRDISYKVLNCSTTILSELIDDLINESRYSESGNQIILYVNLDSVDSVDSVDPVDPTVLREMLDRLDAVTQKLDLSLICLTTSRFLDNGLLNHFDQIYITKQTSSDALDELMKYLVDNDQYYQVDRLRKLISLLDSDSISTVNLDNLLTMMDCDLRQYGRIVVS